MKRKLRSGFVVAILVCSACSTYQPVRNGEPYRPLPEQPDEFISAPLDPRVVPGQDPASTAIQWLSSINELGVTNRPHIAGQCLLRNAGQELPCVGITLVLLDVTRDPKGVEVGRQQTRKSGIFIFLANPGREYSVQPLSVAYIEQGKPSLPLHAGDQVVIHLVIAS